MKMSNWKSSLIYGIVAIASAASVSIATYQIIKIIRNNKETGDGVNIIESDVPENLRNFSLNNSFKVAIQSSPAENGSYYVSQGTAWSWYYKQTDALGQSFDWYLMTNFHVVNEGVANANDLISLVSEDSEAKKPVINDYDKLLNYYKNNSLTKLNNKKSFFGLYRFEEKNNVGKYRSVLSFGSSMINFVIPTSYVTDVSIITDFNNDSVNLFSENNKYNLDISLIKISLKFNNPISNLDERFICPNVYDMYLKTNKNNDNLLVSNTKKTYIAGNPASKDQLISVAMDEQWILRNQYLNYSDLVLSKLHAPYYFANKYYDSFPLSEGASGSAVYQFENIEQDNIYDTIPLGIYWGGASIINQNKFKPSFIPFYENNMYNIFNNFENYLNEQENL